MKIQGRKMRKVIKVIC